MPLLYLGEQSLADVVPGLSTAVGQLQTSSDQLKDLKADKDSQLNELSSRIAGMNEVLSAATLLANQSQSLLSAANGAIQQSDALTSNLSAALGTSGVHLLSYAGQVGQMAQDVADVLGQGIPGGSGSTQQVSAIVILASDANAWAAIQQVLRIS